MGSQAMTFGKHSCKYSQVIFIIQARCVPCEVRTEYVCVWCRIILIFILLHRVACGGTVVEALCYKPDRFPMVSL
jgi:hypothetical protein